jgi:hypothetical protein
VSVLAQRQLSLVAAALLGAVVALAIAHRVGSTARPAETIRPVVASPAAWTPALAEARTTVRRRSACGWLLRSTTLGVMHPVLPCGAKLFLLFHGRRILTQVVDRPPAEAATEFQVTPALATKLGLEGRQPLRWTFARG